MATITTETRAGAASGNQSGLGGGPLWHRSAPTAVSSRCQPGRPGRGWEAWSSHLAQRAKPRPLAGLVQGTSWPVTWNLPDGLSRAGRTALLGDLARLGTKRSTADGAWHDRLEAWLAEAAPESVDVGRALESLAVTYRLPQLAERVSVDLWWDLLEYLMQSAAAVGTSVDLLANPLPSQLFFGELPLALTYLFPEIKACRRLRRAARGALSVGLGELLDGEGLPRCCDLPVWGPLLACWTRCRALGAVLKNGCWSQDADVQYRWLVTQTIRFARYDGSQMFSHGAAGRWSPDLLATALALSGDAADVEAARKALPSLGKKAAVTKLRLPPEELPEAAVNSEWSGLAVLRPDWSRLAPRLAVRYGGSKVQIELNCRRDIVLSGTWGFHARLAGTLLEPAGHWEEVCWASDEEMDYL